MFRSIVFAVFALWLTVGAAFAQSAFDRAVETWLAGNDRDSLPMLADRARNGHRDARILLARIESMDHGPSPYRLSMSRQERRALFRDVSGTS